MKRRRVVMALVIGVLLAVGAAVPVAAHVTAKRAHNGTVAMYHYAIDSKATTTDPQYIATGHSTVSLTYTTSIQDYSFGWLLSAAHLKAGVKYALVEVWDVSAADTQITRNAWWVRVLDEGRANRIGMLAMSGRTSALRVPEGGRADWARSYSADLWLVPSADLVDSQTSSGFYLPVAGDAHGWQLDDDWWLTSLGVPVDGLDNNALVSD